VKITSKLPDARFYFVVFIIDVFQLDYTASHKRIAMTSH